MRGVRYSQLEQAEAQNHYGYHVTMTFFLRDHDKCLDTPATVQTSLTYRILLGVGMALVACLFAWMGGHSFSVLVALVCAGMLFEWTRLVQGKAFTRSFYAVTLLAVIAIFLAAGGQYTLAYVVAALSGMVLAQQLRTIRWAGLVVGYIIASCIALIWIRSLPEHGRLLTFVLLISVWATDIGAYCVGKIIGGALLAPAVSPGKTWAGAVGGVISAALCAGIVGLWTGGTSVVHLFALSGVGLSLAAITGDLLESGVKRRFGVKDMSGVIPGHGGVLDRLDGMILGTLVLALILYVYHLI